MKRLLAVLILGCVLIGCSSGNITMKEIDDRLDDAGYTISQVYDNDNKLIWMSVEKLNIKISHTTDEEKLSNIVFTDLTTDNQYVIDVINNTEMATSIMRRRVACTMLSMANNKRIRRFVMPMMKKPERNCRRIFITS